MSTLRFKHVFFGLMGMSVLTGFVIPGRFMAAQSPAPAFLFAPVAAPARGLAGWAHHKISPEQSSDTRSAEEVKRENEHFRDEISGLQSQLADLKKEAQDQKRIGDIRALCTPYDVLGTDTGTRSTLLIQASSFQGLKNGMYVLYSGGIVGQVQQAGAVGTRVQLVSDLGFRVRVGFVRFTDGKYARIDVPQKTAEGTGKGTMLIKVGLTHEETASAGLRKDDWVILDEPEWPVYLQGRALGKVTSIKPLPDAPLYDQVTIEPAENLLRLKKVMIVTKESE